MHVQHEGVSRQGRVMGNPLGKFCTWVLHPINFYGKVYSAGPLEAPPWNEGGHNMHVQNGDAPARVLQGEPIGYSFHWVNYARVV